jgi:adenosylcobyric acid synthase
LVDVDLVVLPGTRATVAELDWLRSSGLADAISARAAAGAPVLGICGGYQMLARTIVDEVESGAGAVDGLGLLPTSVRFAREKTLGRPRGAALGAEVVGYEIHHGVVEVDGGEAFLDGCVNGSVWGTTWHGVFENDEFRRAFLRRLAADTGRDFTAAATTSFAGLREDRLDVLGDLVEQHLDTGALIRLIESGAPAGLPVIVSSLTPSSE